jgi:hypothetical protein
MFLDVFKSNAFSSVSLTASINLLPYAPSRLSKMGLFTTKNITTTSAVVERKNGKLSLVPTAVRGAGTTAMTRGSRKARNFIIPHLPLNDEVLADEVQNVRAFGSEDATPAIADVINERLGNMKQNLEVTKEYHRIGAVQGNILDADGTTAIYNLFTEFGITETVVDFDFTIGAQDMKTKSMEVIRDIEDVLGAQSYDHVHALCGRTFFDSFVSHPTVAGAFERWDKSFAQSQQRTPFFFGDIAWEEYRGKVGTVDFIDTNTARFFPVGVPNLFQEINAPANFIETVNTPGKPFYAKQAIQKMDTGVDLHAQANTLMLCTQPELLIKGN